MSDKSFRLRDRSKEILPLIIIILLAAALRFYKLGDWSLWVDEAFTIHDALHRALGDKPINYLFVRFFLLHFGVSEWTARIGPALVGILSIVAGYYFFKRVFDQKTALLGSLFLSLSSWHIYWSQNARHYSLVLFFAILCLWCFYSGFERDKPSLILLSLVFAGLGLKTHASIVFVMPALVGYLILLYLFKFERSSGYNRKNLLVYFIPVTIAGLMILPKLLGTFTGFSGAVGSGSPLHVIHTTVYYVQIPFFVLTFIMVIFLLYQRDRRGLFLCLTGFVPLIMLLLVALFVKASSLYVYYTLPIYCVGTAFFIVHFARHSGGKINVAAIGILVTVTLIQFSHVYFYFTYQHGDRPRWKEAAYFLKSHCTKDDVIISNIPAVLEYYLTVGDQNDNRRLDLRRTKRVSGFSEINYGELYEQRVVTWVVINCDVESLTWIDHSYRHWITNEFHMVKEFAAWTGGKNRTVKVYRLDNKEKTK